MIIIATLFFLLGGQTVQLEEANTPDQKVWGLMGRSSLKENDGMLFFFDPPEILSVWMFNCWIDLDVAFLDSNMKIQEIHYLKAYPEKMDPKRPVLGLNDFRLYPHDDPVIQFFHEKSVKSSYRSSYILEMPGGWFKSHQIKVGDPLVYK